MKVHPLAFRSALRHALYYFPRVEYAWGVEVDPVKHEKCLLITDPDLKVAQRAWQGMRGFDARAGDNPEVFVGDVAPVSCSAQCKHTLCLPSSLHHMCIAAPPGASDADPWACGCMLAACS